MPQMETAPLEQREPSIADPSAAARPELPHQVKARRFGGDWFRRCPEHGRIPVLPARLWIEGHPLPVEYCEAGGGRWSSDTPRQPFHIRPASCPNPRPCSFRLDLEVVVFRWPELKPDALTWVFGR